MAWWMHRQETDSYKAQLRLCLRYPIQHICPVSWGCKIHQLRLCRGIGWMSCYDSKPNSEAPLMLDLCEMRSTLSLPLFPGPLWLGDSLIIIHCLHKLQRFLAHICPCKTFTLSSCFPLLVPRFFKLDHNIDLVVVFFVLSHIYIYIYIYIGVFVAPDRVLSMCQKDPFDI